MDIGHLFDGPGKDDRSTKALRRLRRDFPELHQRYLDRELSLTAAAVEAGADKAATGPGAAQATGIPATGRQPPNRQLMARRYSSA